MVNVRGYISSNFTKAFLTIFLPFFLIISLVFLVKISSLTSRIQITFGELFELFTYSIPEIIFYTLPLSFVAALVNVLVKLSQDNELIALYALGLKAKKILKSLLLLGTLFSILLLSISFLAMPLSNQFYKSFKAVKKSEAKLNIVAGKLGQKFGNYYIYLEEKKDGIFHNIVIYNRTKKDEEQFFSAHEGKLSKKSHTTSLLLNNGYGYTYTKNGLQQVEYKKLEVYDTTKKRLYKFQDISIYWSKAKKNKKIIKKALFNFFISLIPLLSVYLVAAFTMINPRYQSNHSFIIIFSVTFIFYILGSILQKWGNIYLLILFILSIVLLGKYLFKQRVERYF